MAGTEVERLDTETRRRWSDEQRCDGCGARIEGEVHSVTVGHATLCRSCEAPLAAERAARRELELLGIGARRNDAYIAALRNAERAAAAAISGPGQRARARDAVVRAVLAVGTAAPAEQLDVELAEPAEAGASWFRATAERTAWRCVTLAVWTDTPGDAGGIAERYAAEHGDEIQWTLSDFDDADIIEIERRESTDDDDDTAISATEAVRGNAAAITGPPAIVTVGAPNGAATRKVLVDIEARTWVTAVVTIRASNEATARRAAETLVEADPDNLAWRESPEMENPTAVDVRDE